MPMTHELQERINQTKAQMLGVAQELLTAIHRQMNLDHASGMQPAEMVPAEEKIRTVIIEYQGHIGVGEAPPGPLTSERPAPSDTSHVPVPGAPGTPGHVPGGDHIPGGTFGALSPEEHAQFEELKTSLIKILRGVKNLVNTEREDLENVQHILASVQGSVKELGDRYRKAVADKRGDELNHELAELNTKLNLIHADIERVEASLRETRDTVIAQEGTFQMELDHRVVQLHNLLAQSPSVRNQIAPVRTEQYVREIQELRDRLIQRQRGEIQRKDQEYADLITLLGGLIEDLKPIVLNAGVSQNMQIFDSLFRRTAKAVSMVKEINERYIIHEHQTRRRELGVLRAIVGEHL